MRLARLELYGFKSFPDRTTFHFGPGISCVVGPNGSGKSNVVDALKWCVGEQSARSLRGSEMTDVIFAGSTDRKPVGFAEVVLTLATDDAQPFPGDYAALREVQVGRRLHRSGTSDYTINAAKVRRRDVVELLLDSGIGNDLYSFIEQGQVDKMISASPADRRSLIDEAAGISRYKARRDEARERLEATAAQLDRAADVVDEMARHLGSLEGQVLKAAEFRRHGALVRLGELRLALAKHLALAEERVELRADLDELRANEAAARADVEARDADLVRRRDEIGVVEAGLVRLRDQLAELDGAIREANATAALSERREGELRTERTRSLTDAERQAARAADERAQVGAAEAEIATSTARVAELDAAHAAALASATAAEAEVLAARTGQTEAEAELQRAVEARVAADVELAAAQRDRGDRELRIAALGADQAELEADRVRKQHARQELDKAVVAAEATLTAARAAVEDADRALAEVRAAESEARAVLTAAEEAREAEVVRERERRKQHLQALERGRKWVTAAEQLGTAELRAAERGWTGRIAEAERAGADRRASARATAGDAGAAEVSAAEGEAARSRAEHEAAVRVAAGGLAEAKAAFEASESEHLRATRARAAVEAELAVVRRQLAATSSAGDVVRRVVPAVRALAELAPDGQREAWVRALGDRAGWPVVRDRAALVAIAAARPPDATVQLVWWPEGAPSPASSVTVVAGLEAALDGALPAAGDGFRIDGLGFVTLGPQGALERAVVSEAALGARGLELDAAIRAAAASVGSASSGLAAATEAHRAAVERRDQARAASVAAVEAARQAKADGIAAAEASARAAAEAELAGLAAERDRALGSLRAGSTAELDRLRAQLARAEAEPEQPAAGPSAADAVGPARTAVAAASERTEAARSKRERAVEARVAAERARDGAVAKVAAIVADIARVDARIADCAAQAAELVRHRDDPARLAGLDAAVRAASDVEQGRRAEVAERKRAAAAAEGLERRARDAVARVAVDRASTAERIVGARQRAEAAATRATEADQAAERARTHAATLGEQADEAAEARRAAIAGAGAASDARGAVWDQLEGERVRAAGLGEAAEAADEGLRAARARIEGLAREVERVAARQATLQSDVEVLRGRIDDRYQVSLPAALEKLRADGRLVLDVDPDVRRGLEIGAGSVEGVEPVEVTLEALRDERAVRAAVSHLDAHRQALSRLGEVNLAAPAEYRDLLSRHDELAAQRHDLEQSVEGIRAAIAKLNRMCRERFRETFDRVNAYFQDVYPRLVGGGSARLALTNEEDLLETGVEIFVQPPGKRLQNLQLLSGGEKAMTAIALLIALFRVKPSPFCVLDEVDAPLDEANGARFNEMLKEMATRSQFLVITHNRKTMECADTLYGITMARPGVSRLVSVDLGAW